MALGRKRDDSIDERVLTATMDILADVGFDSMTVDMVIARAGIGKASVYRRWTSKSELVRDALIRMNRSHLELDKVPDTGNLREDLLAVLRPHSIEDSERKLRVLAGLGSFLSQNAAFLENGAAQPFDSWMAVNREILQRASDRGEISRGADIETACQVLVSMVAYRGLVEHRPFDSDFFRQLIDRVLLPLLASSATRH